MVKQKKKEELQIQNMTQGFGRIKRFRKPDVISEIVYNIPHKLVGGAFFYGKIKAGKTTAMMALAQKYRDQHNYKIFDIHGGQRNENMYWTLPSDEINYWDYVKKKFSIKEEQEGPKQYKVKVLYPFFANHIPEKLPNNPPNVKSELFTIPIKSLDVSDFKLIINNMSENANYLWREISTKLTNKDSGEELIHMLKKAKGENQIFYKNVIKPLVKEKFLQSKDNRFNIDIIKELKDRETVNVLCLKYIPHEFHLFVVGWILRQTKELLDNGKVPKRNIFIFREAGEYFRMKDNSVTEDKIKWFRKLLTDYIRYGRRGMHMFVDTQSACLCENTNIFYKNKDNEYISKKIKELPKNFKVPSYNFKINKIEDNSARKIEVGQKECYEIELEDGEKIITTEEHRFFDKNDDEIKVKNLKIGMSIVNISKEKYKNFKISQKIKREKFCGFTWRRKS
ncbi:MAG: hypothetical protein ACP6IY_09595 [Promethearchaeia archaeon]